MTDKSAIHGARVQFESQVSLIPLNLVLTFESLGEICLRQVAIFQLRYA